MSKSTTIWGTPTTRTANFEKALEYQQRALRLNPENGDYHYYVGALLYQLGEMERAIPYLTTAISKKPWYHGAHYNLGRALIASGQLAQGQAHLAQVDSLQQIAYDIGLARYSRADPSGSANTMDRTCKSDVCKRPI